MRAYSVAFLLAIVACRRSSEQADIVFVNGNVITVDSADRVAQAVAIKPGRILAVGTTAAIDSLAGPSTERIDLGGLTMTPGLLDAHAHFASGAVDRLYVLDLSYPRVKSIADVLDSVAMRIAPLPKSSWLVGQGWDEGKFAERRLIRAADLDRVSPDHPVWLSQTMGHYGVANSAALRLAQVTRDTKDPPAGTIDRDAGGNPTGVLKESAQGLVRRLLPDETGEQLDAGIRDLARAFNAEGMTGLKDPGISAETWDAYKRVQATGDLSVRVFALWRGGRSIDGARKLIAERGAQTRPYETTGDDHVVAGGVKLFIDGSGGARTAWLYDDWNKGMTGIDRGNRGYPASNPDTVRQLIRMYHDAGMHVSTHSIGDRAIDWTVDSYARAMRENPKKGLRHGIIHSNIPSDRALDSMAKLQREYDAAYPEPSATFMWWIGDTYAGNFGPLRDRRLNPLKAYLKKGIRWANGSDYNVTPFPARYGIWAAVARQPLLGVYPGDPYGRDEAVDVHAALRAVTIWAARQMFLEKKIGSIEPGKYADLAVWDRDVYGVATDSLKDMRCLLTVFNGRIVHRDGKLVAKASR